MGREDAKARIVERAEERERIPLRRAVTYALALAEVVQGRLVAVMPIGDVHARVPQRRGDTADSCGVVDALETVALRADRCLAGWRSCRFAERPHKPVVVAE